MRLAVDIIWIVLAPAEMLGVLAGLGYFMLDTQDRLAYSERMAMIVLIGGGPSGGMGRGERRRAGHARVAGP